MKEPKITVKKVSSFQGHDGVGVNADVYIDGVYAGHFYDDARGGEPDFDLAYSHTDPTVREKAKAKVDALIAFAKEQPQRDINADKRFGDTPMMHQASYIDLMDYAINDALQAKEDKKMDKMKASCLMWGKPNGLSYTRIKFSVPLLSALPLPVLQAQVDKVKKELKEGEVFLNAEHLQSLGVRL